MGNLNRTVFPRIYPKVVFQRSSENPSEVLDNSKTKTERPGDSDATADTENRSKKNQAEQHKIKRKECGET